MKTKTLKTTLTVSDYNFLKGLLFKEMQDAVECSQLPLKQRNTIKHLKHKYYYCKRLIQQINKNIYDFYDI